MFAIITSMERTGEHDNILDFEVINEIEDEPVIVGMTALEPTRPYIVSVRGQHMFVDWDIKWL